jgi:hypothetical protein
MKDGLIPLEVEFLLQIGINDITVKNELSDSNESSDQNTSILHAGLTSQIPAITPNFTSHLLLLYRPTGGISPVPAFQLKCRL